MSDTDVMNLWRERLARWQASDDHAQWQAFRERRDRIRNEVRPFIERFAAGEIDVASARETVRERIRADWDFFGTQGSTPCSQFLGQLIDHMPDIEELQAQLREALPVPEDMADARARIRAMADFVERATPEEKREGRVIQPRRIILFLSGWWQMQDQDWMAAWRAGRRLLNDDGLYAGSRDFAEAYNLLVDAARAMAERLGLDMHDFEGLCRHAFHHPHQADEDGAVTEDASEPDSSEASEPARPYRHVWLIAPGRNADQWNEHYRRSITGIGWNHLGDLRQYDSWEELNQKLRSLRNDKRNPFNSTRACYNFAHVMQPGDIIFAKRGMHEIVGAGVITGDYRYLSEPTPEDAFHHVRDVRWTHYGSGDPGHNLVRKTLTEVTRFEDFVEACAHCLGTTVEDILREAGCSQPESSPETDIEEDETPAEIPYTREQALAELLMDEALFDEMLELLEERRNIVLQGPPGVGKTYLAARLAWVLLGTKSTDRLAKVQFHQSMTYEDFVRGFRPTGAGFELRQGPFLEFLDRARQDLESPYVMIIDEINRGNLSRILGELMLLIEPDKRSEDWALTLTYASDQEKPVWVPPNVHLIGTMNTADRSLALVDYALRRRFAFIDVPPAIGHRRFREHLHTRGLEAEIIDWIATRFSELNRAIREDANLGAGFVIGHSYFCAPQTRGADDDEESTSERWYRRVVRTEIVPLLREYWFDAPDQVRHWQDQLYRDE